MSALGDGSSTEPMIAGVDRPVVPEAMAVATPRVALKKLRLSEVMRCPSSRG
ncbi:hypothetical protein [Bradyrhizobium lablabi]|uniref:hypothetical protein n=1 Tax=Bradyrhizobium lablabi TaxID=722472 RepID=UPI0020117D54|nr:hypothetical protein [Bradyrhizobium lablabi]